MAHFGDVILYLTHFQRSLKTSQNRGSSCLLRQFLAADSRQNFLVEIEEVIADPGCFLHRALDLRNLLVVLLRLERDLRLLE